MTSYWKALSSLGVLCTFYWTCHTLDQGGGHWTEQDRLLSLLRNSLLGGEFTFVGGSLNKEEKNFWTRVSRKAICQMSKLGWEKAIGSLREEGGGRKQKSERGEWKSWLKAQHSENEDHGIWSHHFMGNRWGNSGNSVRLYFWGPQNHCRWWLQPWN